MRNHQQHWFTTINVNDTKFTIQLRILKENWIDEKSNFFFFDFGQGNYIKMNKCQVKLIHTFV